MHGISKLEEVQSGTQSSLGRAGLALVALRQRNAPVVPSVIVTSTAFKEFVILSGIRDRVFSLLRARECGPLQKIILEQEAPEEIEEEVYSPCSSFGHEQFRAYSSSTLQNHEFSQHVPDKQKLMDAVKACWASIITKQNIPLLNKGNVFSAVVLQPSPAGAKKGRIYTINPLTNSKEKLVIELTDPEHHLLLVNKSDSRVINEGDFQTLDSPIYIHEKDALITLAGQIAGHFRKPLSIEWVGFGKDFFASRVTEFDMFERARFMERVKEKGIDLGDST